MLQRRPGEDRARAGAIVGAMKTGNAVHVSIEGRNTPTILAHAEFLIHAVNSHERLARALLDLLEFVGPDFAQPASRSSAAVDRARSEAAAAAHWLSLVPNSDITPELAASALIAEGANAAVLTPEVHASAA
jgi:hypothetical protein